MAFQGLPALVNVSVRDAGSEPFVESQIEVFERWLSFNCEVFETVCKPVDFGCGVSLTFADFIMFSVRLEMCDIFSVRMGALSLTYYLVSSFWLLASGRHTFGIGLALRWHSPIIVFIGFFAAFVPPFVRVTTLFSARLLSLFTLFLCAFVVNNAVREDKLIL